MGLQQLLVFFELVLKVDPSTGSFDVLKVSRLRELLDSLLLDGQLLLIYLDRGPKLFYLLGCLLWDHIIAVGVMF